MTQEMAVYNEGTPEGSGKLIALALERNADPATLERLMALQERWEANSARKAYVAAMSAFKLEAPAVLKKGDKVDFTSAKGRTHYNYANLGSIVQEISALLGKYQLSASWETTQNEKGDIAVTCHITHVAGHRESVMLRGPADDSGGKNRIQQIGSTVTYLQRYTLLAALGLATGEADDDGDTEKKEPIQQPQAKKETPPPATHNNIKDPDAPATEPQIKAIHAMMTKAYGKLSEEDKHAAVAQIIEGFVSFTDLTKGQASTVIETLNAEIAANA